MNSRISRYCTAQHGSKVSAVWWCDISRQRLTTLTITRSNVTWEARGVNAWDKQLKRRLKRKGWHWNRWRKVWWTVNEKAVEPWRGRVVTPITDVEIGIWRDYYIVTEGVKTDDTLSQVVGTGDGTAKRTTSRWPVRLQRWYHRQPIIIAAECPLLRCTGVREAPLDFQF